MSNQLISATRIGAVVTLAVCTLAVSPASGLDIHTILLNVQPTPAYTNYGVDAGEWLIPSAGFKDGSATGAGGADFWFINPSSFGYPLGMFDWSGSMLDQDLSVGGQAEASFLAGGQITFEGTVVNGFGVPLFTGPLLVADVSSFIVKEFGVDSNTLDIEAGVATITPVSGWLTTPAAGAAGMQMVGDYWLEVAAIDIEQNGMGLVDFQEDIINSGGMQVLMYQVPEPATALLLIGGLAMLRRRR